MDDEVGGPGSDDKIETLLKPSEMKSSGLLPFLDISEMSGNSVREISNSSDVDNSEISDENISNKHPEGKLTGWLTMMARGIIKTNRQRWFVYGDRTCKLYYYRSENDVVPHGEIDISRATFNFEPSNVDKPGLFQIRSDNREHVLDASNRHAMMYWLQELQKRRRIYNSAQSTKLLRQPSKRPQRLTGLDTVKFTKQPPENQTQTEGDLSPTRVTIPDIVVPGYTPLEVSTGDSMRRANHGGSFTSIKTDIREAFGAMMSGHSLTGIIGGGKMSKTLPSPSPSTNSTTSEDWTVLDTNEQGKNVPRGQSSNAIMNAFNKIKTGRKGSNPSLSTETQVCHRCKQLQSQLNMSKEEQQCAEDELQAHREIVRLLQKELDVMSRNVQSRKEASNMDVEGLQNMVTERDKHITELQYSIVNLKEEKAQLSQTIRSTEGESEELKEQVTMYQEMLNAKDDTIMQLTNEITALEKEVNNNLTGTHNKESDGPTQSPRERQTVIVMTDTQELARLKDMCQAYELQNKFLTKEILELNYLRQNDQANEKALSMSNARLEAQYYQTRSKYLYLLQETKKPKYGGEVSKPDDVVCQLLNEAEAEEFDSMEYQFTSSGQEYDRYGFIKKYGEDEEEIDPLSIKAEQMGRHSEEVQAKLKDAEEIQSCSVKWENYMVGLGKKTLTRSSDLKALVRMGVPSEYREQIWKGCVNFYVGEIRDKLGPHYYKELSQKTKGTSLSPESKQIELDLLRTLPNNRHFESIESKGIEQLRQVLLAYSVHNPIIGYCQGLNRLAAITLLFLPEEEAFWCLVAIVDFIMPTDYYSKSLLAAQVDQRVLKDLLHEKLPRLYAHFEQLEVDISLFTFNWFLTIFIDNIPTNTFLRIWDTFLYEGSKVLFRFAVAFFKHVEERILHQESTLQLNHFMRVLGEKMNDPRQICHLAFNWINPFPMRSISTRRQYHLQLVKNELAELNRLRSRYRDKQDGGGNHGNSSDEDF